MGTGLCAKNFHSKLVTDLQGMTAKEKATLTCSCRMTAATLKNAAVRKANGVLDSMKQNILEAVGNYGCHFITRQGDFIWTVSDGFCSRGVGLQEELQQFDALMCLFLG